MKTPKEIKDFLNNKVLANINFTAKEIISDNTPEVEAISIDDFIEWFESGVLIPYEFYYSQDGKYSWVIQFKGFRENKGDSISYYYMLKIHNNTLNSNSNCNNNGWVEATPAQKQQLIDKVQEETGKVWNEDTKMFEDKPKDILVPECIKIIKYQNNQLGLVFNDNKQVLTFSEGVYIVQPLDKLDKFISCRLEKTTFEELHEGDIFFEGLIKQHLNTLLFYNIKIGSGRYIYIDTDDNTIHDNYSILSDSDYPEEEEIFYKVVPLN